MGGGFFGGECAEERRARRTHVKTSLRGLKESLAVERRRVDVLEASAAKITKLFEAPSPRDADPEAHKRRRPAGPAECKNAGEALDPTAHPSYPRISSEMTKQMEHYKHGSESRFRVASDGADGRFRIKVNPDIKPVYKKL